MSLKENLQSIKEEIGAEEQFLESIIKGERFYKKYKKYIFSGAILIVIVAVGYTATNIIKNRNLKISNQAYEKLIKTPNDSEALSTLKDKNPSLYSVFLFQEALKKKDTATLQKLSEDKNNQFLSDLASYELAQMKNTKDVKSDLLNGFVLLEDGFDLLKQGKQTEAELKFAQIDPNSPLADIVKNLEHYQVKSK
ncbi:MAG: hypothetical protein R3331_07630 [Sulfurospirillaceae bacterium]|nr:hypothetical protein [Sulfurospirillaceae bacterium]